MSIGPYSIQVFCPESTDLLLFNDSAFYPRKIQHPQTNSQFCCFLGELKRNFEKQFNVRTKKDRFRPEKLFAELSDLKTLFCVKALEMIRAVIMQRRFPRGQKHFSICARCFLAK